MMDVPQGPTELDDTEAEAVALRADAPRADPRAVPHAEMREWLLRIAAGDFAAEPSIPRTL
jgi:Fe-S-cluster formation regulator IscX/YfhJ